MAINSEWNSMCLRDYCPENIVNQVGTQDIGSQHKVKNKLNVLREAIFEKNMATEKLERLINRTSVSELKAKCGTKDSMLYLALKSGNDVAASMIFKRIATINWSILAKEVKSISKKIHLNTSKKDLKLNVRILQRLFSLDKKVHMPDSESYLTYALAKTFAKNNMCKVVAKRNCKVSFNRFEYSSIIPELLGGSDVDVLKKAII